MCAARGYEVLGVGAPLVDQILQVSEEYLAAVPGRKGGMETVDYPTLKAIIEESGATPLLIPGGSGSNTIRGLAHLKRKCALIGKIGNDPLGVHFLHSLKDLGIEPLFIKTPTPTAQVICLVTPDGQRTCRSYLGASQEMGPDDLDPSLFEGIKLVHIEGYTLLQPELTRKAMVLAKEAEAKVSFDLASFEIVENYKPIVIELISKYVDILFANIDETRTLTNLDPEKGCLFLQDLCEVAIVLLGKEGCWVGRHHNLLRCPAYPVEPLDTTGAGDLFASGFLHGYLSGFPLEVCAHYGALAGAAVVKVLGAELAKETWHELRLEMEKSTHIVPYKPDFDT